MFHLRFGWLMWLTMVSGRAWVSPERLDRGLVVVPDATGKPFLSWRRLAGDKTTKPTKIYRQRGEIRSLLAEIPVDGPCNYQVASAEKGDLFSVETSNLECPAVACKERAFWDIPLKPLADYSPGDCSVGDLDGDGQWEIVVHRVKDARDNGSAGITSPPILEAYRLSGEFLWRIDLGKNIRDGEHYTQFMVFDLDGDGRAEVACKTADGSTDGLGTVIGDAGADHRHLEPNSPKHGRILKGPEFLTVFRGQDGKALHTVPYEPGRDPINGWGGRGGNGGTDSYGNRCDRFLACVAYLGGEKEPPSLVMARGVYGRTVLVAWDFKERKLTKRWTFDSGASYPPFADASPYSGMGGHSLTVADVDADGKDEIVYQAMTIDDNGKGLYSTGRRHGDTLHVSDFDPARPGMELYLVTENEHPTDAWGTPGIGLHDARTGQVLWSDAPGVDVPHGMVADIHPDYPGAEVWGGPGGLRTIQGKKIGKGPQLDTWTIWWDGDLMRELYGMSRVVKWDWKTGTEQLLFDGKAPLPGDPPPTDFSRSGRRRWGGYVPNFTGDILGDWREELLLPSPDRQSLRLHSTTLPSPHGLPCLLLNRQYRLSLALQNVVYNKPPHPSFFLGHGMK